MNVHQVTDIIHSSLCSLDKLSLLNDVTAENKIPFIKKKFLPFLRFSLKTFEGCCHYHYYVYLFWTSNKLISAKIMDHKHILLFK